MGNNRLCIQGDRISSFGTTMIYIMHQRTHLGRGNIWIRTQIRVAIKFRGRIAPFDPAVFQIMF